MNFQNKTKTASPDINTSEGASATIIAQLQLASFCRRFNHPQPCVGDQSWATGTVAPRRRIDLQIGNRRNPRLRRVACSKRPSALTIAVGRENLTEGVAPLDTSGAWIICQVLVRGRTSPAGITILAARTNRTYQTIMKCCPYRV